jgi:septal ring factor EnvC (AmiA/AmiB activator)
MLLPLGVLVLVLAIAAALALAVLARTEIRQLRSELDETQRQLNETRRELDELRTETHRELNELKVAAAEAPSVVAPPPLPRARSARLDDLREQLRASHREETGSEE